MQAHAITLDSVLVVEDDPLAQARLSHLLHEVGGQGVQVHAAADLRRAREFIASGQHYDIALVDVSLPDGSGVDFIGGLAGAPESLPAVIVSSWADEGTILAALRNGAIGYLLKSAEDAELTMSLRSLQRGGAAIDPVIARRILELMTAASLTPLPEVGLEAVAETSAQLTEREAQILTQVAQGLSNREIAEATGLSRFTIESHTRNIYRKLAVKSRTAAVHAAREQGLLP